VSKKYFTFFQTSNLLKNQWIVDYIKIKILKQLNESQKWSNLVDGFIFLIDIKKRHTVKILQSIY